MALSSRYLFEFYYQLSVSLKAGVPLQQATAALHQMASPGLRKATAAVKALVQKGHPLADAFLSLPALFPTLDQRIIALTEKSGAIDTGLLSLSQYHEKKAAAIKSIVSACILPGLLLIATAFVIHLPRYILSMFGTEDYSLFSYLRDTFFWIFAIVGIMGLPYFLGKVFNNISSFHQTMESITDAVPVYGHFRKCYLLSQWLLSLRLMLNAGFGILEALRETDRLSLSPSFSHLYDQIHPDLENKMTLGDALERTGRFPPLYIQFFRTGEQSGNMDDMLAKLTEYAETEWQRSLKNLSDWLPRIVYGIVSILIIIQIFNFFGNYISQINNAMNLDP
jgi:type II secretory pathway component PulF